MHCRIPSIWYIAITVLSSVASGQLNDLAKRHRKLYFGTETEPWEFNDTTYRHHLNNPHEFGQLVPGNSMKWEVVQPGEHQWNFTLADEIADLAQHNGQYLRCHNLVWHEQLPSWLVNGTWGRENLTAVLINHIQTEVSHYRGRCYAWDVVNEALNDNGTLRSDMWLQTIGPEYLIIAFEAAAKADPNVKLYYNEYDIEFEGPKHDGALKLVKMIQDAGLKIDGIGFQSHFAADTAPGLDEQLRCMKDFTDLGLELAVTELDVRISLPDSPEKLQQQKDVYADTVEACLRTKDCVGITVWDFWDTNSWIPQYYAGYGEADLYFANWTRKPAYAGVEGVLKRH
ncbi:glycoside hydrolase superfamily [Xylogone sp. PMI_703]|nr:glycoside hydrolase superfamily [Xylogone sp. PMI_703]